MSRDGSGNYSLYPTGNPVTTNTTISSTWANGTLNDLATAMTQSVSADGQTTITGNLKMGTNKLTGLGAGSAATDSANLGQVAAQAYIWCGTAGGTANALTLAPSPSIAAYAAGQVFRFKSSASGNSAATTVAVSGLSTQAVQNQGTALAGGEIEALKWYQVLYDGAAFQLMALQPAYTTDATPIVNGSSDASKKLRLEVDGLTTATTRVNYQSDEDVVIGTTWDLANLSLVASVAGNALTVAVKTAQGVDASASNPIMFKFRNVTAATGTYTTVPLTGALSLTVSNGSTLGTVNATPHRLYLVVFNDASTLRLGIYNPYSATGPTLRALNDAVASSSTAEGGGTATSAQVIYTGTAATSKSIRTIGYIESTQATAGTWVTSPSKVHILQYGDTKTGDVVQTRFQSVTALATGTTTIPLDNTIPQNTEGDQYMSDSITPTNALNVLRIRSLAYASFNGGTLSMALFQDSTANALKAMTQFSNASAACTMSLNHFMAAGTTSSTTFKWRIGASTAGTTSFNGILAGAIFNGTAGSETEIAEIFV
jgi:hypothetical protein